MTETSSQLPRLPPEVLGLIFAHTSKPTAQTARLGSKYLCATATPRSFRHVQLKSPFCDHFKRVAEDASLRGHVKEITCDARAFLDYSPFPLDFLEALPFLRYFSELKVLNLKFNDYADDGDENAEPHYSRGYRFYDLYTFRRFVIIVSFYCIQGGSKDDKDLVQLAKELGTSDGFSWMGNLESPDMSWSTEERRINGALPIIHLEELTIANLAEDINNPDTESALQHKPLPDWPIFQRVMALPTLKSVKFMVAPDDPDNSLWDTMENEPTEYNYQWQDLFLRELTTWFRPELARNLTTLALYYDDIWGYQPKFDFRLINPGSGPECGLPHLKVLGLGRYCFSHEWQLDWFASLGRLNSAGGIEELYLDECVVISKAYCTIPQWEVWDLDRDRSYAIVTVKDIDGNDVEVSNRGYLPNTWDIDLVDDTWAEFYHSSMSWHELLDHWSTNMTALKIFKMGTTNSLASLSGINLEDHVLEDLVIETATICTSRAGIMDTDIHAKFDDAAFRKKIGMMEMAVPFYVNYSPRPNGMPNWFARPWFFIPVGSDEHIVMDEPPNETRRKDILSLEQFKKGVEVRAKGGGPGSDGTPGAREHLMTI
ncbi:hypothetical protein CORC01_03712 [Colletotrichum orchidophilum]|uniref:F-box domain-containing protein n=1 Tax=Colletotrichum orchidophilum TaxID=1209926 RepID=A0A1G4BHL1_9PEZI|nr:uncharacterized protein CORC01_03712 [Colletotrichum orchidophilum]OHF00884.1 hypothetical protein CORC01_03712 [Colletotrichum orchidophilum]